MKRCSRCKLTKPNDAFEQKVMNESLEELYRHRNYLKTMLSISSKIHELKLQVGEEISQEEMEQEHIDAHSEYLVKKGLDRVEKRITELT